jgi:hypothetical protein
LRQAILSALLTRFDFTGTAYVRIKRRLARARGEEELGLLLEAAIVAESVVDFEETLQATIPAPSPTMSGGTPFRLRSSSLPALPIP